jgi:hypothetical protein
MPPSSGRLLATIETKQRSRQHPAATSLPDKAGIASASLGPRGASSDQPAQVARSNAYDRYHLRCALLLGYGSRGRRAAGVQLGPIRI